MSVIVMLSQPLRLERYIEPNPEHPCGCAYIVIEERLGES